jgi:hypothetical protein
MLETFGFLLGVAAFLRGVQLILSFLSDAATRVREIMREENFPVLVIIEDEKTRRRRP